MLVKACPMAGSITEHIVTTQTETQQQSTFPCFDALVLRTSAGTLVEQVGSKEQSEEE